MNTDSRHITHRQRWRSKAVLRLVYEDYFRRMLAACGPGLILEIGGGSGGLAQYHDQGVIGSDISWAPWLHLVADAQQLPLRTQSVGNIAMVDVLHHVAAPARFFSEAARVLVPGGRIVMLEPAITALSAPFYRYLHPEPVDTTADPLAVPAHDQPKRDLYDGNQAIPTTLFTHHAQRWQQQFPQLRLVNKQFLNLWCYPLSGGYRPWSLLPAALTPTLLALERRLEPTLGRWLGFRLLLVVEKSR